MKRMLTYLGTAALTAVIVTAGARVAQAQGTGEEQIVPLKVTLTIARFQGERQTASLPFVMWVNTGRGSNANIRMGSDVPIPTTTSKDGVMMSSYTYRSLGTNIDCTAGTLPGGLYRVSLSVEDSQVFRSNEPTTAVADVGRAVFQTFRATHSPILRDGQTVEFAVATDKTSGEVIKLQVKLDVVK